MLSAEKVLTVTYFLLNKRVNGDILLIKCLYDRPFNLKPFDRHFESDDSYDLLYKVHIIETP